MEQAEEYVEGNHTRTYENILIRGNNGLLFFSFYFL